MTTANWPWDDRISLLFNIFRAPWLIDTPMLLAIRWARLMRLVILSTISRCLVPSLPRTAYFALCHHTVAKKAGTLLTCRILLYSSLSSGVYGLVILISFIELYLSNILIFCTKHVNGLLVF